ncbi:MAG: hypothetical protein JWP57_944 [Spirosoma sp.]|nr:hypothetical protein [Spirosoma sp.]
MRRQAISRTVDTNQLLSIETMPPISTKIIVDFLQDIDFDMFNQRIHNLKITPQPNSILFGFTTNMPTVPVIEIFRLAKTADGTIVFPSQNLVTVKFDFISAAVGNYFTDHQGRIDGLNQDTDFSFRITAGNGTWPAAIAIGSFKTGKRKAAFVIRDILVFNDGDPGGSREMGFAYGIYNEEEDLICSWQDSYYQNTDLSSGQLINLPFGTAPTFIDPFAPDWMAVYVEGFERDSFGALFGPFGTPPDKLPENTSHYEDDDGVKANAFQHLQLPDDPGNHRVGFSLDSGPWGIHYITTGWVDVDVTPAATLPIIPKSATMKSAKTKKVKWPLTIGATLHSIGQQVGIEHPGGGRSVMALGPNGLLALRLPARRRQGNYDWKMIEAGGVESAALVAIQEGILLFALSGDKVRQRNGSCRWEKTRLIWNGAS